MASTYSSKYPAIFFASAFLPCYLSTDLWLMKPLTELSSIHANKLLLRNVLLQSLYPYSGQCSEAFGGEKVA